METSQLFGKIGDESYLEQLIKLNSDNRELLTKSFGLSSELSTILGTNVAL